MTTAKRGVPSTAHMTLIVCNCQCMNHEIALFRNSQNSLATSNHCVAHAWCSCFLLLLERHFRDRGLNISVSSQSFVCSDWAILTRSVGMLLWFPKTELNLLLYVLTLFNMSEKGRLFCFYVFLRCMRTCAEYLPGNRLLQVTMFTTQRMKSYISIIFYSR